MEDQKLNIHQQLTQELITIEEMPSKIYRNKFHNFKRLNTFNNFNRNSLFSIKKASSNTNKITTPKLERSNSNRKESSFSKSPKRTNKRKTDTNIELNNYFNIYKSNKNNNIPTISGYENEDEENLNKNSKSVKIVNTNIQNFNKKIDEIYNMYQKTYENSSMESLNKEKKFFNSISNSFINKNKVNYLYLDKKENRKNNHNIDKRNYFLSNTKSKTTYKKNTNKSLKLSQKNILTHHHSVNKNNRYYTSFTEGNIKRGTILYSTNSFLREKVIDVLKELNLKKNTEYYILKREEMAEKIQKNQNKNKTKNVRGKLVSLLNKEAENKDSSNLNYISKKKMQKNENQILIRKPTNNIEMNNLIINSFGAGYNHNEYSKKIFNLNETFFNLLENMKKRRAEMDIAKFEREKNKYIKKGFQKQSYDVYFQKNYRDKWEKKFMHDQYHYRIPEKEFKKFRKEKQIELKKKIIKNSQKLSELLTNMDAQEYEFPDVLSKQYKSTKNSISMKNVKRIYRIQKILKNVEDDEQTGKIIFDGEKIKKEQKKIESEIIATIGRRGGKPRFVKTVFKPKTIRKYKGISGNFFGLPV